MGIRLLPSAPGTKPYDSSFGDLGKSISDAYLGYQTGKKRVEDEDTKALERLLLRGELTGELGNIGDKEKRALERYGITDPSKIKATAKGREFAGIESAVKELGVDLDDEAKKRLMLKTLGIEQKTPQDQAVDLEKGFAAHSKMNQSLANEDSPPPQTLISQWEELTGQPWPTITRQDPVTGQPLTRPASYKQTEAMKPEKIRSMVMESLRMATKRDSIYGDLLMNPAQARSMIESQVAFILGDDWKTKRPDVEAMVEEGLAAHGLGGLRPQAPAPGGAAATPQVSPAQRSIYNQQRAMGKSVEEARRIAGF
jgi:hypothetical protein